MKKCLLGLFFVASLIMLLVLTVLPSYFAVNESNPLEWIHIGAPSPVYNPATNNHVISADALVSSLFSHRKISHDLQISLLTWNRMHQLINNSRDLPDGEEAVGNAQAAWERIAYSSKKGQGSAGNESLQAKEKQCPQSVSKMSASKFKEDGYKLSIPCGLIQGSSITLVGIPNGNFRIDLMEEPLPGNPEPPIILHYNVRLLVDNMINDHVIVQNTWTAADSWGKEERCPLPIPSKNQKGTDKHLYLSQWTVDQLDRCNEMVGKKESKKFSERRFSSSKAQHYFPFKQGHLSVMTLRVGEEGIQMTVDGKQITSFAYRKGLDPWLVSEARISGDLKLTYLLANGLPSSEASEHKEDIEALKSVHLQPNQSLDLFIGIFSTANNFNQRMAVRGTWMQYPAVKTGAVAVRFFVGLHKKQIVNEELWAELQTYGDIQLMPFVDYYSLITWKTIAICIFGAEVVSAKYVMKTDDDAFVRVDEVLASLNRTNVSHGLLYGLINSDAQPHRDTSSKWYVSYKEWPDYVYPPLAHGPGYVISHDIAKEVYMRHRKGQLKMFKLEDVAMGIWIAEMKRDGLQVSYVNEKRVCNVGCNDGYVVAHYQSPRQMLCLWHKLQVENQPVCCAGY